MSESHTNKEPAVHVDPSLRELAAAGAMYKNEADGARTAERLKLRPLIELVGPELLTLSRHQYRYMELALDVAERDGQDFALLKKVWPLLEWTSPVCVSDEVYRAHAREILNRVLEGKPLQPGTRAEVLAALAASAARATPDATAGNLLLLLFEEVWGPSFYLDHKFPPAPSWSATIEATLGKLSLQLLQEWRECLPAMASDNAGSSPVA
ncbi:MAG: hypothetical protein ACJ8R9_05515 [Steroidobacteraceae bacterium]